MIALRSLVTRKLLNLYFSHPERDYYVNELVRALDVDKRNLVKKLKELERHGLMRSESRGNLRLYSLNSDFPLYGEYESIFKKTLGVEKQLRDAVRKTPGVVTAYIYGSYARNDMDADSDIDLLVVGRHRVKSLQKDLDKVQRETDREVNCVHISEQEFKRRRASRDPFLRDILEHEHIRLME